MLLLWVTLLALHQVYSLVPVISVELGEPVTFTCSLPTAELSSRQVSWYKQRAGDALKLVAHRRVYNKFELTPEFNNSRFKVNHDKSFIDLTIVRTIEEDEGLYHCTVVDWSGGVPVWSGTYLLIKGNLKKTSNYEVVQLPTVSGPHRPGDPVTLQCSLLSGSEDQTCPEDHSVYWFRAGSDKSHPDVIYTDGNKPDKCNKTSDSTRSCVYNFTKNVSSSDSGTHYCAVATCGQILFGSGTKMDIQETCMCPAGGLIFVLCGLLVLSLSVIVVLIFAMNKNQRDRCNAVSLHTKNGAQKSQQRDEDTRVYSAVVFTVMKTNRQDTTSAERRKICSAVTAFGLDQ